MLGPVGHFQTGERNRPEARIRRRVAHRSAQREQLVDSLLSVAGMAQVGHQFQVLSRLLLGQIRQEESAKQILGSIRLRRTESISRHGEKRYAGQIRNCQTGRDGSLGKVRVSTLLIDLRTQLSSCRIKSIDMRYQVWKWGVIFTDNVRRHSSSISRSLSLLSLQSFLYVFFYFFFSVIGNFSFFVFAIHLLDVAISVKALSTILKSITHNGRQVRLETGDEVRRHALSDFSSWC